MIQNQVYTLYFPLNIARFSFSFILFYIADLNSFDSTFNCIQIRLYTTLFIKCLHLLSLHTYLHQCYWIKYNFNIHSNDNSLLVLLTANCLIHLRNNQSFAAAKFLSALNKIKSHTFDFRNTNLLTFSIGK